MASLPTLLVNGNSVNGPRNWTSQSYLDIDEGISAADAALISGANKTNNNDTSFLLANMPTDFGSMDTTLAWNIRWARTTTDDLSGLQIRIVDETTGSVILAAADAAGTFQTVLSNAATAGPATTGATTFTYVNTGASKTQWDDARVELRQTYAVSMAADASVWTSVDSLEFTGTYTVAAAGNTYTRTIGGTALTDSFTDTNGAAWSTSLWTDMSTADTGATASTDIQSNAGRLHVAVGGAATTAKARANSLSITDAESVFKFQVGHGSVIRFWLRTGSTATGRSADAGYCLNVDEASQAANLRRSNGSGSGATTQIGTGTTKTYSTNWWWARLQATGTTIRYRIWQDGTSEPSSWDESVTDSTYASAGTAMVMGFQNTDVQDSFLDDVAISNLSAGSDQVGISDSLSVGQERFSTDAIGVLDNAVASSSSGGSTFSQTITDSVGITDSKITEYDANFDPIGITDAASYSLTAGGSTFSQTITDSIGITDSVSYPLNINTTTTDVVSVTDAVSQVTTAAPVITDSVGVTDSTSSNTQKNVIDSVGITDGATASQTVNQSVTDPVGATDAATWVVTAAQSSTDPIGILDAIILVATLSQSVSDGVGITDSITADLTTGAVSYSQTVTDVIGIVDSTPQVLTIVQSFVDSVGIQDIATAVQTIVRVPTDLLGIADTSIVAQGYSVSVTDTIGLLDSPVKAQYRDYIDVVGITDGLTQTLGYIQSITDVVGIVDAASNIGSLNFIPTELVGISDVLSLVGDATRDNIDALGVTDPSDRAADYARTTSGTLVGSF